MLFYDQKLLGKIASGWLDLLKIESSLPRTKLSMRIGMPDELDRRLKVKNFLVLKTRNFYLEV